MPLAPSELLSSMVAVKDPRWGLAQAGAWVPGEGGMLAAEQDYEQRLVVHAGSACKAEHCRSNGLR